MVITALNYCTLHYHYHDIEDTIVAIATPPGAGAIGVIRLSGKDAIRIVDEVFFGKDLSRQASHTIHFGTIRDAGRVLDEVLVSLFVSPKSYTGEDVVEVSCHGSHYILQQLLQLFVEMGARLARPGEFTLRAFLHGRMDLSQAEAVADLVASHSASAHRIALNQMRGGISNEIAQLREELIHFASLIELELDFGEEDVEFANRKDLRALVEKILSFVQKLIRSFELGNAIKNGVSTVIAGRPNAGKSTLLNALLEEDRAIVSEIAGTTRDTIEEMLNINGITFRLIDTAGIREAQDQIEAIGVEKTMEKVRQAAILVYVFDVTQLSPAEVDHDLRQLVNEEVKLLIVANKMDLHPYTRPEAYVSDILHIDQIITASAKNAMNVPYLKERLYHCVLSDEQQVESAIVSNARHIEALQKTADRLAAVIRGMDEGITGDFIAMDIRQALAHLGEITGQVTSDDLLGNIFSRFCIGK